jgi:hypothetical protein
VRNNLCGGGFFKRRRRRGDATKFAQFEQEVQLELQQRWELVRRRSQPEPLEVEVVPGREGFALVG